MAPGPHRYRRILLPQVAAVLAVALLAAARLAAEPGTDAAALTSLLSTVGERVRDYFARAQSLVCLETVHVQPLGTGLSPAGLGRNIESELRMSWEAVKAAATPEARLLRQVLKVNGGAPRKRDPNNCTAPEQFESETPAISMLLPHEQGAYTFKLAGTGRLDNRAAIMIDYREIAKTTVDVWLVPGNDECLNFDMKGGLRGRIWLDAETNEVLRLDQALIGLVDVKLPRKLLTRTGGAMYFTMERWDTTIRFASMSFQDPEEKLLLPVSVNSLRITRGSGDPRQRTMTEYTNYKRFMTGGRILPP